MPFLCIFHIVCYILFWSLEVTELPGPTCVGFLRLFDVCLELPLGSLGALGPLHIKTQPTNRNHGSLKSAGLGTLVEASGDDGRAILRKRWHAQPVAR